ncbi:MAG: hypothetical protein LBG92_08070 [Prevotellaceae bacterium]|jgi:hypothetical protein|nr:hypothetical protein [Prevotellaceae bacterium]
MNNFFTKSNNADVNYLPRIIEIKKIIPHSNADRLECVIINGNTVIIAKGSFSVGDVAVYVPLETTLNFDFLSRNNQFEDKTLNTNSELRGFFNKHGRVRACRLRGEPSMGFIFPFQWFTVWQPDTEIVYDFIKNNTGLEFDTVNGIKFSQKYISRRPASNSGNMGNKNNLNLNSFDRMIDSQFHFHIDTLRLDNHIDSIKPDDTVQITKKMHGTSGISALILTRKKLKWYNKILKKLKFDINDTVYDNIYSSRTVIKNKYINKSKRSYYPVDVWGEANKQIAPFLIQGMTVYYEIVGYLPNNASYIQSGYDYGCNEGEYKIFIYRITLTNANGDVFEFSTQQVQEWCKKRGLNPVHELYYGKAKDIYPDLDTTQHWHEELVQRLRTDKSFGMEEFDNECINKVPFEGIVIRKERLGIESYKLKCFKFYEYETDLLDKGETNIEDANNI